MLKKVSQREDVEIAMREEGRAFAEVQEMRNAECGVGLAPSARLKLYSHVSKLSSGDSFVCLI